ncbi:MAG TPA: M24B family metallopeptidase, partial [Bdellovibrionota bacterium]|nr:M24B family metallopeptidase [Bdellovibrionota bacterium]
GEMRLFKAPEEVEALRGACRITALAHTAAMKEVKPGMNEFEVEALIDYTFRKEGCQRVGYGSIVAGGVNAACLHYRFNNQPLRDGDLLLIDAGGEFNYYTSDITRTFPVGRQFTDAQAKAYELVLKSQKSAIAMAKPGAKLPEIHKHVCEILTDGMLSLGLLKGNRDEILKSFAFRRFYPHNTSHWLGMDVHDVGLYMKNGEARPLEPGMCFTIEPGFYVQPTDKEAPREFHGIGIRIEDDILITRSGNEILTKDAPKEIADIEALRR